MKNRHILASLALLCAVETSWAQVPAINPSARPTFSPWLNLNRQGTSPAVNYYGIIRPQVNANSAIQQLQQQAVGVQQQLAQPTTELPPTGNVAGFLNHQQYFLNHRGGFTAGGAAPAPPAAAAASPARSSRIR